VTDLFYGTDYNSHLGTKRGGLATYSEERGFIRSIHNLESTYFRTKFEDELDKFKGNAGIGIISDTDAQPIIINSHLGRFAIVTVAKITNIKELEDELLSQNMHFAELSSSNTNQTELIALLIIQGKTFVEIKNQKIYTHPMKGTIEAEKQNAIELLKNDVKEKAEHYTVVDLLRNDLSMIADNVQLDEFQRIDYLKTSNKNLYAMSSEISGDVKPEFQYKIGSLLQKILPAGSILGAPKPKTLEVILEAENYKRGFYTGVAGCFDGENLDSCVIIRYIENKNSLYLNEKPNLVFKSGGGITHLSKLEDEYQEMKNKIYVPIH
jgi:isochorismate synthase EntC